MRYNNVVALFFLASILLLPWASVCSSQTASLYANNGDLVLAQKNLEGYVDQFCSQEKPNNICYWVNKTGSFSITYNYTGIESSYNYTNFRTACLKADGNFCEVSHTASIRNSTNYLDDDGFYDDDGYYTSAGSTKNTLIPVFINSPWCFAKNACDLMDITASIQAYTLQFYGGEILNFDVTGTSCTY